MASYLMYITSPQVALVDIMQDQWALGFEGSFAKHVGLTLDQFYVEFNNFMKQGSVEEGEPWEWEGSPNMIPPENFFLTSEPLSEAVDFWSIDSGIPDKSPSNRMPSTASSGLMQFGSIDDSYSRFPFDEIIGNDPIAIFKGKKRSDDFDIVSGSGYSIIKKFNPKQDWITFCGCPATKLDSHYGDTYISKGGDLQAIVRGVEANELMTLEIKFRPRRRIILRRSLNLNVHLPLACIHHPFN